MARPRKEIDREQVRKLAAIDCTVAEIAAVVGVSVNTIDRRCKKELTEGREQGCASLKRKQFELALAGNPTMLIWLGKQRLGQKDVQAHSGESGGPVRHIIEVVREPLPPINRLDGALAYTDGNGNGSHS